VPPPGPNVEPPLARPIVLANSLQTLCRETGDVTKVAYVTK